MVKNIVPINNEYEGNGNNQPSTDSKAHIANIDR